MKIREISWGSGAALVASPGSGGSAGAAASAGACKAALTRSESGCAPPHGGGGGNDEGNSAVFSAGGTRRSPHDSTFSRVKMPASNVRARVAPTRGRGPGEIAAHVIFATRKAGNSVEQDPKFVFDRFLPLIDPDSFSDPAFYVELEKIGYRQVLLGGTGSAGLIDTVRGIKANTGLTVALYPAGPDAVCPADVVIMPDVMNSNSHFARPFGSGSVATAMNIFRQGLNFVSVAYIIMGNSTARWYFDAFLLPSTKILLGYANYARMVGYRFLALDYEDPALNIDHDRSAPPCGRSSRYWRG